MQTQRFAALAQGLGTPGVRGPCWFRARGRRPGCHGTWMPGLEGPLGLWVHPHASAIRPGGPAGPRGGSLGPCLRDTQPGEEVQSGRGPEAHGVGQRDCGWGSRGYPPTWGGRSLEAPLVGRPLSSLCPYVACVATHRGVSIGAKNVPERGGSLLGARVRHSAHGKGHEERQ